MSARVRVRSALLAVSLLVAAAALPATDHLGADNLVQSSADKVLPPGETSKEAEAAAAPAPLPVNLRFPHAVLFGRNCGGTIIAPTWVITAGHCTIFTAGRSVLAGTNNTRNGSGLTHRVKRLIIHPRFSVGPYWLNADQFGIKQIGARWDFLLAELEDPLPLDGKTIAAVPLDDSTVTNVGLEAGYAGYGAKVHGETMRHVMHGMDLGLISDDECQKKLPEFDPQDMVCTRGLPPRYDSACNGDSGSGLVGGGKLLGVASWVENDAHECRNGAIVVFSRIAAVRDWIRQVTKI